MHSGVDLSWIRCFNHSDAEWLYCSGSPDVPNATAHEALLEASAIGTTEARATLINSTTTQLTLTMSQNSAAVIAIRPGA